MKTQGKLFPAERQANIKAWKQTDKASDESIDVLRKISLFHK